MRHLTKREKEILACLKEDPLISQDELAAKMKISRSAAAVHISNLMRKGYILGRGYILEERSGVLIVGKSWLEIAAYVDSREISISCGGLGCEMAAELAGYNIAPILITVLGQDESGDQIYNYLLKKGVEVRHVIRSGDCSTAKRLHVFDGENVLYHLEDMRITQSLGEKELAACGEIIKTAKVLLIDASLSSAEIKYLLKLAKSYDILTTFVGGSLDWCLRQDFCSYPQVFLVCWNHELPGFSGEDPESCYPVCREIVGRGLAALIVIFDEQGVVLATPQEAVYLPFSPLQGMSSALSISAGIAVGLAAGHGFRFAVRRALGRTQATDACEK